jgi:hypothetical protein
MVKLWRDRGARAGLFLCEKTLLQKKVGPPPPENLKNCSDLPPIAPQSPVEVISYRRLWCLPTLRERETTPKNASQTKNKMAIGDAGEPAAPQPEEQEEPFSWQPLLADKLVGKDAKGKLITLPTSSLNGKHVLVYFSAHWCERVPSNH